MSSVGSVTFWLQQLVEGEQQAVQALWERYFARLVSLIRTQLRAMPRQAADEEDVALSAFDSFCRAVEAQRFPRLDDRDDLWQVLVLLAGRKAIDLRRRVTAQKQGGGQVRTASELTEDDGPLFAEVIGREPDPAEAAAVAEQCQRLLALLPTDELRQVALWKLEGHSNAEIAAKLHRAEVAAERKLRQIRARWQQAWEERQRGE